MQKHFLENCVAFAVTYIWGKMSCHCTLCSYWECVKLTDNNDVLPWSPVSHTAQCTYPLSRKRRLSKHCILLRSSQITSTRYACWAWERVSPLSLSLLHLLSSCLYVYFLCFTRTFNVHAYVQNFVKNTLHIVQGLQLSSSLLYLIKWNI
jgi:hypothetical protein